MIYQCVNLLRWKFIKRIVFFVLMLCLPKPEKLYYFKQYCYSKNKIFLFNPSYFVRFTADFLKSSLKTSSVISCHSRRFIASSFAFGVNLGSLCCLEIFIACGYCVFQLYRKIGNAFAAV